MKFFPGDDIIGLVLAIGRRDRTIMLVIDDGWDCVCYCLQGDPEDAWSSGEPRWQAGMYYTISSWRLAVNDFSRG